MIFRKWPKIPRLNRDMVITEKIDGTNAQILIMHNTEVDELAVGPETADFASIHGIKAGEYTMFAGSRKRFLSAKEDNFGFFKWVVENKDELIKFGPGRHYGEWWGQGIQRKYGLKEKRLSMFNPRWQDQGPDCVDAVPVLYVGGFDQEIIRLVLKHLKAYGSKAARGFMKPEGLIVFHIAGNNYYKVTCEKDDQPKGAK